MLKEVEMFIVVLVLFFGFRFFLIDVEFILYYFCCKIEGDENFVVVIVEVEIYKFELWDLLGLFIIFKFFYSMRKSFVLLVIFV